MKNDEAKGLPNDTQFPKERKDIVEYRPGEPGQDCVSCVHFNEPESCEKVTGMIYRSGTCNLWEADTQVEGADMELEGMGQEDLDNLLFGSGE